MLVAAEIGRHIRGGVLRDVTADTVTETQLEHIDPVRTLHEFLAVDVPTGSHGPDGTFLVFRAGGEEVGLVPADTSAHGVPAVVGVGRIAVERYVAVDQLQEICRIMISKAAPAPDSAHGTQSGLVDQGIGHQIRVVVVKSAVLVIVLVLPGFGSHQRGNLVFAGEGLVEVQLLTEVVRSGNIV
ncbi:unknown [Alistipes sp. CAG:831]|nr:unknown [Alistipes sp. CAG:831]